MIITLDLCLRRGDNRLIEGLNLHIEKGEFVFICGQAGSGKTSLLRLIALQNRPAAGRIIVDGRDTKDIARREYPAYRRSLGIVFRDDPLLAYRTIAENIEISLELAGWKSVDARAETDKCVKRLGLRSAADLFPAQASANERKMGKLCRALARRPRIALVDEPFEGLDAESIERATELFAEANLRGSTIVATTHNVESVGRQNRRAIMLDKVSLGRMEKTSVD